MAAMTTALILGTMAAAASYGAYETKRASDFQKKAAGQAEEAAMKTENEAKKLKAQEEADKFQTVMRNQKRRGAVGEPGLRDTILTGALGTPGQPQTANKTLLGA